MNTTNPKTYESTPARHVAFLGLGVMGFQDALYRLRLPYASREAIDHAGFFGAVP